MAKTGTKSAFKLGEGKMASVILPTQFTTANAANAKGFTYGNLLKQYATKESKIEAYAGRTDAIDLNDGACPVFNSDSLNLSPEEFEQTFQDLNAAQLNGNNLYSMAFSFRGDWLVENNLYDPETGEVDQIALKRAEQDVVDDIFNKGFPLPLGEDKDDVVWFGVIHHDTDHLNMHLWFAKKTPETRPEMIHENGEPIGYMNRKVIQQANRKLQTNLESEERRNYKTDLYKKIEVQKKTTKLDFSNLVSKQDDKISAGLQEVWDVLPDSTKGRWMVGPGTLTSGKSVAPMTPANRQMDKFISNVLETNFKNEMQEFMTTAKEIDAFQEEMYGKVPAGQKKWSENKMDALKKDIANEIYRGFNEQAKKNPDETKFDSDAFNAYTKNILNKGYQNGSRNQGQPAPINQHRNSSRMRKGNGLHNLFGSKVKDANAEARLTKKAMKNIEKELEDEPDYGSSFSL